MAIDFSKTKKARAKKDEEPPESYLPVVRPTADIARAGLLKFENEIVLMTAKAELITIENDETLDEAVELGTGAAKLIKIIEHQFEEIIAAPKEFVKKITNFKKTFTLPLFAIKEGMGIKVNQYRTKQELNLRQQEEEARKATEELQRKINADAEKAGVEPPRVPDIVIPKAETITRVESGSSFQRKDWVFEMEDENLLPREYLMVNDQAIRAAIKAGIRKIPGVRIFEKSSTTFRTA